MWHHAEMATIGRADTCHVIIRAIGVGGIAGVVVFRNHMVGAFCLRQMELTLAVGYPQTKFRATQRAEHHTIVLWDAEADELTLKLMRVVVQHPHALGGIIILNSQFSILN